MKAIRHVGIVVSDIEKSLYFYRDLLGLQIQKDMVEEGKFIDAILGLTQVHVRTIKMSADDGNLIELLYYLSPEHIKKAKEREISDIGAFHVAFTVENIDAEYEKLKREGTTFNSAPKISVDGKAKVAYCFDPNGIPIELVEVINT